MAEANNVVTTASREKQVRENAQILRLLPIEDLAELLSEDEFASEVMEAAAISPQLMDKVAEAIEMLPSRLSPADIAEAQRLGRELADKRFGIAALSHSVFPEVVTRACTHIAKLLGVSINDIEQSCLGWSDPRRQVAMAASSDLELTAMLERAVGTVTIEINRFGVAHVRAQFDLPPSVGVFLYDLSRQELIRFATAAGQVYALSLKARTTRECIVDLTKSLHTREDMTLIVVSDSVQEKRHEL